MKWKQRTYIIKYFTYDVREGSQVCERFHLVHNNGCQFKVLLYLEIRPRPNPAGVPVRIGYKG